MDPPNYLDHKSREKQSKTVINTEKSDIHEAIISRDDFLSCSKLTTNAKSTMEVKRVLPRITCDTKRLSKVDLHKR